MNKQTVPLLRVFWRTSHMNGILKSKKKCSIIIICLWQHFEDWEVPQTILRHQHH